MRSRPTELLLLLLLGAPAWAGEEEAPAEKPPAEEAPAEEAPAEEPSADEAPAEEPPAEEPPAEEPPADDAGWIELTAPVDFGSALDVDPPTDDTALPDLAGLADASSAAGPLAEDSAYALPSRSPRLRARFALRPWLGAFVRERDGGPARGSAGAGATVAWQWWSLRDTTVRPAGETRLRAVAPFGGLRGWQLRLDSAHGAWLGPVALLVGPSLQAEALRGPSDLDRLSPALQLGPQARLAAQLGRFVPWVEATPRWQLAGDRPLPADTAWHGLSWGAGLVLDGKPLGLRLSLEHHDLVGDSGAATPTWQAALGLHLRLL